ncbi:hypothetical protein HMPREF9975_09576 [Staphylococcus epidermidis NIHLM001]|nr:hypothetical protein HMPREF9975_09576 [Staphylococcus epidermidis NIHLM001]
MKFLKNKSYHLLVTLIVLTIFVISGAIFFNIFRLWFVRFESHPYLFTLRRF